MAHVKETHMEISRARSGESMFYQRCKQRLWKAFTLSAFFGVCFFAFKNHLMPILSWKYGIWKTIL
jgi:hypothetical protein